VEFDGDFILAAIALGYCDHPGLALPCVGLGLLQLGPDLLLVEDCQGEDTTRFKNRRHQGQSFLGVKVVEGEEGEHQRSVREGLFLNEVIYVSFKQCHNDITRLLAPLRCLSKGLAIRVNA